MSNYITKKNEIKMDGRIKRKKIIGKKQIQKLAPIKRNVFLNLMCS